MDTTDWKGAGGRPKLAPVELSPSSVTLAFIGTTRPRAAMSNLIAAFASRRLRELVCMRRPLVRGRPGTPIQEQHSRERHYDDEEAWWRASFAKGTPPMSEDPAGMLSVTMFGRSLKSECRPAVLGRKGLRIVYGLPNEVRYPKANARAMRVTKVVTQSLKKAFGGAPPALFNAQAKAGQTFERIAKNGRFGYVFAIARAEEMIAVYADCYRYREYELFEGLADAIDVLGLEPVVHWLRDHVFMVNLWERSRTS
jgi:hypothetical protein